MDELDQLKLEVAILKKRLDDLSAFATIPYDVEKAFRDRLRIIEFARLSASTKSASSENQAVNEAGAASYSVLKPPDGFREFVVSGNTLYIPFYT